MTPNADTISEAVREWYDYRHINSRNALWSFVAGPRSIGKTFGAKRDAVKDFLRDGSQTLWIRRSKTELTPAKAGFFDGVANLWPDHDFRVEGDAGQIRAEGGEWQTVVRFASLSLSSQLKGTEYPMVRKIVYDECYAEPGTRYLAEEVDRLRNLWVTVNRSRTGNDGRAQVRVLLLGNVYELDNPWWLEFNFTPGREWQRAANGDVVLHLVDASKYEQRVGETVYGNVLGTVITGYGKGDYFLPDGGYMVKDRPADSKPFATLVTLRGVFGLWIAADYATMYVTVGPLAAKEVPVVAFERMAVRPGVPQADSHHYIRREARRHYKRGSLFLVGAGAMVARQALAS